MGLYNGNKIMIIQRTNPFLLKETFIPYDLEIASFICFETFSSDVYHPGIGGAPLNMVPNQYSQLSGPRRHSHASQVTFYLRETPPFIPFGISFVLNFFSFENFRGDLKN